MLVFLEALETVLEALQLSELSFFISKINSY